MMDRKLMREIRAMEERLSMDEPMEEMAMYSDDGFEEEMEEEYVEPMDDVFEEDVMDEEMEDEYIESMDDIIEDDVLDEEMACVRSAEPKIEDTIHYNYDELQEELGVSDIADTDNGSVEEVYTSSYRERLQEASERLDKVAHYLERSNNKRMAFRIDKISDIIDRKISELDD